MSNFANMIFVFRNNTIERFLPADCQFSGYDDISVVPNDATDFIWWYQVPLKFDETAVAEEIKTYYSKLQLVLPQIKSRQIIIFTLADYCHTPIETGNNILQKAIGEFNESIYNLSQQYPNIKILDFLSFTRRYSASDIVDWKMFLLAQIPLNPKLADAFKIWYNNQLKAISLQRKKCLVLDLDNTLWGGILGEDGLNNIQLSGGYPGKAFHLWQEGLLQLKQSGVILCICSKNNVEDVNEVWQKRNDMLLKRGDFAALRINWHDKATNIKELSKELNIGLDSMVFIDDNPLERELIKQVLPMIEVPEFPSQPYDLPLLYQKLVHDYFQIYAVTNEDRQKTEQYMQNVHRREAAAQFTDIKDYLRSLQIKLDIAPVNEQTLPRAAQLTQKTNQFNLTTKRYAENEIRSLLNSGARAWTLSVADKFGDSGITGLIIITADGVIDTMLMSCRVLGKGIENAFLKTVLNQLRKEGVETIIGQYIKTAKNSQTATFYPDNGFSGTMHSCTFNTGEDPQVFTMSLQDADLSVDDYFEITVNE